MRVVTLPECVLSASECRELVAAGRAVVAAARVDSSQVRSIFVLPRRPRVSREVREVAVVAVALVAVSVPGDRYRKATIS